MCSFTLFYKAITDGITRDRQIPVSIILTNLYRSFSHINQRLIAQSTLHISPLCITIVIGKGLNGIKTNDINIGI